jgi:transaldolase
MQDNPLIRLKSLGQNVWLDYISRSMLIDGELARLIENEGLSGVTSNPTIFEKVIDGTGDYDTEIDELAKLNKNEIEIAQTLILEDIRSAADQFRTLYERTNGREGYVSLEVSPEHAYDTGCTIRQARKLWNAVSRPNIFIKVPATKEGIPAIRELISEGINVNVTLLFGLSRYREVMQAFIEGLETRAQKSLGVETVMSVASFFLSRIDVAIDKMLEKRIGDGGDIGKLAQRLKGKIAVSNAVVAYQIYKEIFHGEKFAHLKSCGARAQRLLWASTGNKNPDYDELMYVEPLIGPDTISTQVVNTIKAYRENGSPDSRIEKNISEARENIESLKKLGIDLDQVTQQLEKEGVDKFAASFDKLKETLKRKHAEIMSKKENR